MQAIGWPDRKEVIERSGKRCRPARPGGAFFVDCVGVRVLSAARKRQEVMPSE